MGGRGSSNPRGGGSKFVGKRVTDLGLTSGNISERLGLKDLTTAQKNTILDVFHGMERNDYSYDKDHTPYTVKSMSITTMDDGLSKGKGSEIYVNIETGGDTGRSYVDSLDRRYRMFFIGKRGGAYTYSNGGKRKPVSGFDVTHGKRDL